MAKAEWLPALIPKFLQRKPAKAPIPRGEEVSLRDSLLYPRGAQFFPWNPDVFIRRKGGMDVYDKMRRDAMVRTCQFIKRLSVVCSGWSVEPVTEAGPDQEVADFCMEALRRIPGTLEEKIKEILSAYDYGFSVTEKVFDLIPDGEFAGKVGIKKLATRKPHRFDFETDPHGNLMPDGLWQSEGTYRYDPTKFIIYSHNNEFSNWYGQSDLQAAYTHWWAKVNLIKFWNVFLEKFSLGIPYLHPRDIGNDKVLPLTDPTYTELKNAIFNLQFTSAIAHKDPNAQVEILESKRRASGEYDKAVFYHDRSIARALLMPTGLGISEDEISGSKARSETHLSLWLWVITDARRTMEELLNEQLLPELINYNYSVKKYPRFKFLPLEADEAEALADKWLSALQGRAVHPTPADENRFRALIKFPERDEKELAELMEREAAQRPSGLPPSWPGMGWETGSTQGSEVEDITADGDESSPAKVISLAEYANKKWHRELTTYEKRVNFAAIEKTLDQVEESTLTKLQDTLTKQRDSLIRSVERMTKADALTGSKINGLDLQYRNEFKATLDFFTNSVFELGRRDSQTELRKIKTRKFAEPLVKLPPRKTMEALKREAFWISGIVNDTILKEVQGILYAALESAESPLETSQKIRAVYEPYLGDLQVIRDEKQIQPYRIETLIRTNSTRAYNRGRMTSYTDPDLEGFVRAVQLSAILDTRTTDICRSADGKIIMLDDPEIGKFTPPLHFNCRTVTVPITVIDEFTPSSTVEKAEVIQKMPANFGGSADK